MSSCTVLQDKGTLTHHLNSSMPLQRCQQGNRTPFQHFKKNRSFTKSSVVGGRVGSLFVASFAKLFALKATARGTTSVLQVNDSVLETALLAQRHCHTERADGVSRLIGRLERSGVVGDTRGWQRD